MTESNDEALIRGREAFSRHAWADAYDHLRAAEDESLGPEDLDRLAMSAHLVGRDAECAEVWARAHAAFLSVGNIEAAARCAFWLALLALMIEGDPARSGGWQSRAQRLLDEHHRDCVEYGYLALLTAIRSLFTGQMEEAATEFRKVAGFGTRFNDSDLLALGRLGEGQVLSRSGRVADGMTLMDEVMVSVTAGEASPIIAGIAYCAVIEECQLTFDLPRAQVWTDALNRWCSSQPGLVPYRRQCLAHRAEILRFHGAWAEALAEAERACELVSQVPDHRSTGDAWYERGEVYRLRGEYPVAEQAYREANLLGRSPNPGLALMRIAQGRSDAASSAIQRELDEAADLKQRAILLAACVEVRLAAGDVSGAQTAAQALSEIAAHLDAPLVNAMALFAQGAVAAAERDIRGALGFLRNAWKAWNDLEAPYEAARARVLIGICCRELGDAESAELEFDAAMQIFGHLGAAPDLKRVEALSSTGTGTLPAGLTQRECEVLRLIVEGKTNAAIAQELVISDHTVRRHVQNIFAKLGVSSRAAAAAFAYQNDLV